VSQPNLVAIVQARMGSSRLPGKVLADIEGAPMLELVVERVRQAKLVATVIVATSTNPSDASVDALCRQLGIACFRGSEEDVLDRYYCAAQWIGADVVVRITADCPLVDPRVVEKVVDRYLAGGCDYVSNTCPPTFPDGLDVEAFSFAALERSWREARWSSEREHVTAYVRSHPELFRTANAEHDHDLSAMRWTVDCPRDLEFVRLVYHHVGRRIFGMAEVLQVLELHPELATVNAGIERNEGYRRSIREDRGVGE
jgi:spore coat polysaccharide biosynthesis protein SpsF (cytidylyltransferase family)